MNSQEAQRLVDLVAQAQDLDTAVAAAERAFSFLVDQLHILGDSANGYPRNPIDGNVWQEGRELTSVCDQFADAVSRWHQRRGEEQATRLAVSMALQVVGHHPEEIFPRVLRNAKCCESLGRTAEASKGYRCILGDFDALDLEWLFDGTDPLGGSQVTILCSLREALAGLQRLSQQGLTDAELTLLEKVNTALDRPNGCGTEFERATPPAQPPPNLIPSEAPWTKLLNRLRQPIEKPGPPPYWTCNIALPEGVTNQAVVDFVFDCVHNKVPSEECIRGLRRELGIDPDDCELALDRVWGGVFRARTGIADNCPDRDTDAVAWASYHKARANPAIISDFYPAQREELQVPWTCPDLWICPRCGTRVEDWLCCWNCGQGYSPAFKSK